MLRYAALLLLAALALAGRAAAQDFDRSNYWWYAVCPGLDYAPTPDECELLLVACKAGEPRCRCSLVYPDWHP